MTFPSTVTVMVPAAASTSAIRRRPCKAFVCSSVWNNGCQPRHFEGKPPSQAQISKLSGLKTAST
ncbi:hypothetical protein D3C86_1946540 [compost metagenome]